jgi:hypothetical protein
MPADYLPFERISYRKPEITSIAEAVWIWWIWTLDPLPPGQTLIETLWTVPTGYKAVISDILVTTEYLGEAAIWIPNGDHILYAVHEAFSPVNWSPQLPPVANAGEQIKFQFTNYDIVSGHLRCNLTMWNVPGSFPEPVEKDDPLERFQKGDFSSCEVVLLGNGESIYIFRKRNEDKENYLRIQNYGTENQKIITAAHLTERQKLETISNLRANPDKAREILESFEKKIKKIK